MLGLICIISYKFMVLSQNKAIIKGILFLYLPADYRQRPTHFVSWNGVAVGNALCTWSK
jgi:hypothetical protein